MALTVFLSEMHSPSAIHPRVLMLSNGHRNSRLFVLFASVFTTAIASAETPANRVEPSREGSTLPGFSLARSGDREDFDFLVGEWTTVQRRLMARGVGS